MDTIQAKLETAYKDAMKARDNLIVSCVRQVKAKVQEIVNTKGFSGEVDDGVYLKAIAAYSKQLTKALDELKDPEHEIYKQYKAEIEYLSPYLPKKLDEAATRALVQDVIAATGASSAKDMGRVMGGVMKDHKEQVDAGLVKRFAAELLQG